MFKKLFAILPLLALVGLMVPLASLSAQESDAIDIVDVTGGQVQGVPSDVEGVQVFKGVPFAGPVGGENRWQPPQPVTPWEGVKVADTWGDQTLQHQDVNPPDSFYGREFYSFPEYNPPSTENGLFLNVWTPAQSSADKLPVFVFIYGGGNDHGFASEIEFVSSKLAAKGIVVVNVSYRVGPFGFLALPELSAESPNGVSGNYAILDLIQSLQWVQDNIAGFGGDPATVTIGGQSAGAGDTTALLRTPLADGLFKRAAIISGIGGFFDAFGPPKTLAQAEAAGQEAIRNVFGKDMTLEELRAIPADEFMNGMSADGSTTIYKALNSAVNGHVVDGYVYTDELWNLLDAGSLDGYDIMIGGTSNETSSLWGNPEGTMSMEDFAAAMAQQGYPADQTAYRPDTETAAYRMSLRASSDKFLQNYIVSAGVVKHNGDNANMFVYYFDHPTPGRNSEFYGAWHSSDLWYWFNSIREGEGLRLWTSADYRMADTMSSYLANFVKNGDPNGGDLPVWLQSSGATDLAFMRFADGYAYPVTTTVYPDRDALNRAAVLAANGLTEADIK